MIDKVKNNVITISLTTKQVLVGLAAVTTVVSVIFGAGMKTQNGIKNMEIAKINMTHQQDIAKLENEKIVLAKDKLVAQEEADFYKGRYLANQKRLKECLEGVDFSNIFDKTDKQ